MREDRKVIYKDSPQKCLKNTILDLDKEARDTLGFDHEDEELTKNYMLYNLEKNMKKIVSLMHTNHFLTFMSN